MPDGVKKMRHDFVISKIMAGRNACQSLAKRFENDTTIL